ncbi:FAD-binding protein [Actinokineospora pegani]|uniref:FAD-binding protein n=1 Tax=Actinokineospora pegani TaxID=2654637 RepID=UPI0012EA86C3|nr:FAD-binding protein [Actinokineospora pegani]
MSSEPITDGPVFDAASDDFGHHVHHVPRGVLTPTTVDELADAVAYACNRGLPLLARGQGHSTAGQSQVADGIVIDMRNRTRVLEVTDQEVTVEAGATWYQVLDATIAHGLTPPVLTDYLGLSVGGTLSVGGVGGASHRHGAQTDNVLALNAVTDQGLTTCSPTTDTTLFDQIRAGRGRHGIIATARIPLVPAPTTARVHTLHYTSLDTFLDDQRHAMTLPDADYLEGQAKWTGTGWRYELELVQYVNNDHPPADLNDLQYNDHEFAERDYYDFATRLRAGEELLRQLGDWLQPHPWVNYLVPAPKAEQVIDHVLATTTLDDIGVRGTVLTYPYPRARMRTPAMPLPAGDDDFHIIALLRTALPDAPVSHHQMLEANNRLDHHVTTNGGTIYLGRLT